MYEVTKYQPSYDEDIDRLFRAFSHESLEQYGFKVDTTFVWNTVADRCRDYSFFLVGDSRVVGMISGMLTTTVMNNKVVLHELMWYVYPEHRTEGLSLLKAFEDEGSKVGATMVVMCLMHNSDAERIGRLYERKGYQPFETHYMKELT